jgi:hypothetical protein
MECIDFDTNGNPIIATNSAPNKTLEFRKFLSVTSIIYCISGLFFFGILFTIIDVPTNAQAPSPPCESNHALKYSCHRKKRSSEFISDIKDGNITAPLTAIIEIVKKIIGRFLKNTPSSYIRSLRRISSVR